MSAPRPAWTGAWVADRLGVALTTTASPVGLELTDLVGLALRRNPRRAHLLVSTVLGKHVPVDPRVALAAGVLLAALVQDALDGGSPGPQRRAELADLGPRLVAALEGTPGAARDLLERATAATAGRALPGGTAVLGYAETATALGHAVAAALRAPYLHSTRRAGTGVPEAGRFEEEHSHATSHLLLPEDPSAFLTDGPLVLVDDELSTGRTVVNTVAQLQELAPRGRYVVAALVDTRSAADRASTRAAATRLGTRIDVVSLAAGTVHLPDGLLADAAALVADLTPAAPPVPAASSVPAPAAAGPGEVVDLGAAGWPTGVRDGARHGATPAEAPALDAAVASVAEVLLAHLAHLVHDGTAPGRVLVLGTEELIHTPQLIAAHLADALDGAGTRVRSSSTTRSPVLPVDADGYAIRTAVTFPAHDHPGDGPGPRHAYNTAAPGDLDAGIDDAQEGRARQEVVLVLDDVTDAAALHAPDGLLAALSGPDHRLTVVTLPSYRPTPPPPRAPQPPPEPLREPPPLPGPPSAPLPAPLRGPAFGSYAPDEVAWLLTDLSGAALEAPVAEREEAVQSGAAHYSESLPVEPRPDAAHQQLFADALAASAARTARAVGLLAELLLATRGEDLVLVSLARAGTPVGILLRRWVQLTRGPGAPPLPHLTASIIRGRGLDPLAVRYLAAHHDPARVVFVDGWTGKGAISRELASSLERANAELGLAPGDGFDPELAVLADPGGCTAAHATREDLLIASACLNSTVSGLVSRTVSNAALLRPDQFHGAEHYAGLRDLDVSARFLDAVGGCFDQVRADVERDLPALLAADRAPTWAGWAAVERISAEHGVHDVRLVKPGVGETTRVLLRRVPWKVLVRRAAGPDVAHVLALAASRGVPVLEVEDLPYLCVGLIRPRGLR